ncbi:MAG TPA: hypothetical protein VIO58_06330 [Candidatus Methanoperedens sp.]
MTNEKMKLRLLIGFIGTILVITALLIQISVAFIVLLLGLLIVPPVLMVASIFIEGVLIAGDRLNRLPHSEKDAVVIFTSS